MCTHVAQFYSYQCAWTTGSQKYCHMTFLLVLVPIIWPLCDFKIFSLLLSSLFWPSTSYDFLNTLHLSVSCLLFSVHTSIHHSLTSIFCIPPYVPLLCFYYYLSTICPLFLAFPFWPWQLNIPFLVTLWVIFLHSPYYTICHITLNFVV